MPACGGRTVGYGSGSSHYETYPPTTELKASAKLRSCSPLFFGCYSNLSTGGSDFTAYVSIH